MRFCRLFLYYAFYFSFSPASFCFLFFFPSFSFSHLSHYSSSVLSTISYLVLRSLLFFTDFSLAPLSLKIKETRSFRQTRNSLLYPASLSSFSHFFQLSHLYIISFFHTLFLFSNHQFLVFMSFLNRLFLPLPLLFRFYIILFCLNLTISFYYFPRFSITCFLFSYIIFYFLSRLFTLSCFPSAFYAIILCPFRLFLTIKLSPFFATLFAFIIV